jgi:glycosyltransferase involved in cell wall biosynthesis
MLAPRNLIGWLHWLESFPEGREPTIVLHLGYAPERFGADRWLMPLLGALQRTGKLARARFVSDSPVLRGKYQTILQQPVKLLPVVVSRYAAQSYKPPGNPRCCACLGNARDEKGFPEVVSAIDLLCAADRPLPARFALQGNDPDHRSVAALAGFRSASAECVSLLTCPLSDDAYLQLLCEADVLLLPYHVDIYRDRTSGVFCEALSAGKPVIVSQGSLMGLQVAKERTGWIVRDRNPALLADTIRKAVSELEPVAARCAKLMPNYGKIFHPDTLVSKLLALADEKS